MLTRLLAVGMLVALTASTAEAQDWGRRGGSDRGDRGGRSFGGGSFGGRSFGGGDRGSSRFGSFGGGSFDPAARMDENQNGIIDQAEIDRIPSFIRDRMDERGWSIEPGTTVDKMRELSQQRMEKMREEWQAREETRREGQADGGNRSTPPPLFKPRDRKRLTVDMPKKYTDSDTDQDGQIGLYEWIVSRRDDLELFDDMDRDSDGLLTPRELVAWDTLKAEAGKATPASVERPKLVIVGGSAPVKPAIENTTSTSTSTSTNNENRDSRRGRRSDDEGRDRRRGSDDMRRRAEENIRAGKPPWGDGPPPWGSGTPPWGDGPPPWERGRR